MTGAVTRSWYQVRHWHAHSCDLKPLEIRLTLRGVSRASRSRYFILKNGIQPDVGTGFADRQYLHRDRAKVDGSPEFRPFRDGIGLYRHRCRVTLPAWSARRCITPRVSTDR